MASKGSHSTQHDTNKHVNRIDGCDRALIPLKEVKVDTSRSRTNTPEIQALQTQTPQIQQLKNHAGWISCILLMRHVRVHARITGVSA